jgi:hypothetical protein
MPGFLSILVGNAVYRKGAEVAKGRKEIGEEFRNLEQDKILLTAGISIHLISAFLCGLCGLAVHPI